MYVTFLILLLIFPCGSFSQENFCQSFCRCSSSSVLCQRVSQFPQFETTHWIKSLTIISSSLRVVPNFHHFDFMALRELRFINCPNIRCEDVEHLIQERPALVISVGYACGLPAPTLSTSTFDVPSSTSTSRPLSTSTFNVPSSTSTSRPTTTLYIETTMRNENTLPSPTDALPTSTALPQRTVLQTPPNPSNFSTTSSMFLHPRTVMSPPLPSEFEAQKEAKRISVVSISVSVVSAVLVILLIAFICYKVKRRIRRNNIVRIHGIPLDTMSTA